MDARTVGELKQIDHDLSRGAIADAERRVFALRGRLPTDASVLYQLGCVRLAQGRPAEAAEAWRHTLAIKPDWVHAVVALANASNALGDKHECLRHCEVAVQLAPKEPQVRFNHARALRDLHRYPDALQAIEAFIGLDPRSVSGRSLRMEILHRLHRTDEALKEAERVLALDPQSVSALELQPRLMREQGALREAAEADARLVATAACGVVMSPVTAAFSTDDPAVLAAFARSGVAGKLTPILPPPALDRQRITVAYLSPDLRRHPVAHMLIGILKAHDRERVRVVTASIIPDNESAEGVAIRALAEVHLPLGRLGNTEAVQRLRNEQIDVLVDLAGCTDNARPALLHLRPAPVQVMWMGCPVSTGAKWYDAWIVDPVAAPVGSEAHASEPLLRLPCCYHPITAGSIQADPSLTRADVGLPEGVPILAALHRSDKITAEMFETWSRLVASHPTAMLWMGAAGSEAQNALRAHAREQGLDPTRIAFSAYEPDRARYLARWRLADIVLDCFPFGGHSTVAEATSMGCPVVTRSGRSVASRVAASMLHGQGLGDYVGFSLDEYRHIVSKLLHDPAALQSAQARFRAGAVRLLQDSNGALTRALEAAYAGLHGAALRRRGPSAEIHARGQ